MTLLPHDDAGTPLQLFEQVRDDRGAESPALRGLTVAIRRARGVVGRTSSREAGLGRQTHLLPAELGLDDFSDWDEDATLLIACAWCERYRTGGRWTTLVEVPPDGHVSHGICPDCFMSLGGRPSR